jgi:hypothetical protein
MYTQDSKAFNHGFKVQFDNETFTFMSKDRRPIYPDVSFGPELYIDSPLVEFKPVVGDADLSFALGACYRLHLRVALVTAWRGGYYVTPQKICGRLWIPVYTGSEEPYDVVVDYLTYAENSEGGITASVFDVDVGALFGSEIDFHNSSVSPTELYVASAVVDTGDITPVGRVINLLPFPKWKTTSTEPAVLGDVIEQCAWMYLPRFSGTMVSLIGEFCDAYCRLTGEGAQDPVVYSTTCDAGYRRLVAVICCTDNFTPDLPSKALNIPVGVAPLFPHMPIYPGMGRNLIYDDEYVWPVGYGSFLFVSPQNLLLFANFSDDWTTFVALDEIVDDEDQEGSITGEDSLLLPEEPPKEPKDYQKLDPAKPHFEEEMRRVFIENVQAAEERFRAAYTRDYCRGRTAPLLSRDIRNINTAVRAFRETQRTLPYDARSKYNFEK